MKVMYCSNPRKVERYPYIWWPDVALCISEGDMYFTRIDDRMHTPHRSYMISFNVASMYDAPIGSASGGGEPYDIDRGLPSGHFKVQTLVSRRVLR